MNTFHETRTAGAGLRKACNVCGEKGVTAFNLVDFNLLKCIKCSFVWIDRGYEEKELDSINYYWAKDFYLKNEHRLYAHYLQEVEEVLKYLENKDTKGKKWLDMGCGLGYMLSGAKKKGFEVTGIEAKKEVVDEINRREKINVIHSIISEAELPDAKFNVITAFDVLEHLNDPANAVEKARKSITDGGLFAIEVPDEDSLFKKIARLQYRISSGRKFGLLIGGFQAHPGGHRNGFSIKSLRYLLNKNGFRVLGFRRVMTPLRLFLSSNFPQKKGLIKIILNTGSVLLYYISVLTGMQNRIVVYAAAGKKKILYLDNPIDPPGGGQFSLLTLLKRLNKEKYEIKVLLGAKCSYEKMLETEGINFEVAGKKDLIKKIFRENPDLIHSNAATDQYSFRGAIGALMSRSKFVWHVRVTLTAGIKDFIIGMLSDKIIVISDAVRKKFRNLFGGKIEKVYNGVDIKKFNPDTDGSKIRDEFGISPAEKVLCIIGRGDAWKGREIFIKAAEEIKRGAPNTRFLIVGEIAKTDKQRLMNNNGKGIVFTGFRTDIENIIAASDIVVHPSILIEAFGRVLIEAMACAKPVVSTNSGGITEIVENGVTGLLVPPGDAGQIAAACLSLLNDPERMKKMGIAGRKTVEEKFSDVIYAKNVEKIYDSII